jgi:hypothetical protein
MDGNYHCWCPNCKRRYEDDVPANHRLGGSDPGPHFDGILIRVCTACLVQQVHYKQ